MKNLSPALHKKFFLFLGKGKVSEVESYSEIFSILIDFCGIIPHQRKQR